MGKLTFQTALDLERHVNQALIDLHEVSNKHGDASMSDFIEGKPHICESDVIFIGWEILRWKLYSLHNIHQ